MTLNEVARKMVGTLWDDWFHWLTIVELPQRSRLGAGMNRSAMESTLNGPTDWILRYVKRSLSFNCAVRILSCSICVCPVICIFRPRSISVSKWYSGAHNFEQSTCECAICSNQIASQKYFSYCIYFSWLIYWSNLWSLQQFSNVLLNTVCLGILTLQLHTICRAYTRLSKQWHTNLFHRKTFP